MAGEETLPREVEPLAQAVWPVGRKSTRGGDGARRARSRSGLVLGGTAALAQMLPAFELGLRRAARWRVASDAMDTH